jgi:hypothetical protein
MGVSASREPSQFAAIDPLGARLARHADAKVDVTGASVEIRLMDKLES